VGVKKNGVEHKHRESHRLLNRNQIYPNNIRTCLTQVTRLKEYNANFIYYSMRIIVKSFNGYLRWTKSSCKNISTK